jgi:hypothetical protein
MRHVWRRAPWVYGIAAATLLAALSLSTPGFAADGGKWRGRAVLVVTSDKTVKVADASDHEVQMQEFDGVVFSEGEKPFLDKARYQVVSLFDSGGMVAGGYKTFTAEDGSKVIARFKGTGGSWPTFKGEWSFVGGTSKFNGISGHGAYTITFVSDTTAWDLLEGDYKIP